MDFYYFIKKIKNLFFKYKFIRLKLGEKGIKYFEIALRSMNYLKIL